jgi:hypothetical protein
MTMMKAMKASIVQILMVAEIPDVGFFSTQFCGLYWDPASHDSSHHRTMIILQSTLTIQLLRG